MKSIFTLFIFLVTLSSFAQFNYERAWGTYFGDDSMRVTDNEVDKDGNIYIVGFIDKLNYFDSNFTTTPGVHQSIYGGGKRDGFIVKFNPAGGVVWSTYFGGENSDAITGMTIDRNDNIYIFGLTYSSSNISTPNAYQPIKNGNISNFIAKLSPTGNVSWSTYYGGPNNQQDFLAIDSQYILAYTAGDIVWAESGHLYLQTQTLSTGMASDGAFQTGFIGGTATDLITKFTDSGQRVWATYYGINQSAVRGITLGSDGIYLGGLSRDCPPYGTYNSYFGTNGALQETPLICQTQFLTKFSFDGERMWSTYYGNATQLWVKTVSLRLARVYI